MRLIVLAANDEYHEELGECGGRCHIFSVGPINANYKVLILLAAISINSIDENDGEFLSWTSATSLCS